jgi:small conductance mechanosensitive channel
VWCETDYYWDVKARETEAVKKSFDANGIDIPFDQLQVHIAK